MVTRRKIPAASEISLWTVEIPTLSGLPALLSQMPERKIKRKNIPATMNLVVVLISTPFVL
jgi:hypothetical protein